MMRFYGGALTELGEREVGVVASTPNLGRDRMIVEPAGIDLTHYRQNPVVLWQHMPDCPVGSAVAVGLAGGELGARVQFAPAGCSGLADEICNLTKAGVIRGVSIGFDPIESEPLDPRNSRAGQRVLRSELMEISFVSIPDDYGAGVVARSAGAATFRRLPAIPKVHVQRARRRVSTYARSPILSPTLHAWMIVEQRQRDREAAYGFAARQADLRRLSSRMAD